MHVIFHLVVKARVLFFMPLRVTYLSVAHNLLFSFISFLFIHIVSYSSPLTGKRYNVDYRANWNFHPPPVMPTFKPITLTIPHPGTVISMFKPFNFNANWDYNFGTNNHANKPAETYVPPSTPPESTTKTPNNIQNVHTFRKQFNWDLNWNFNHGSTSTLGAASHEKEEAPVSTTISTTTTTTTKKPVSDSVNSNGYHGEKRINIELSLNVNKSSSASSSSLGNDAPSTKLQPPNKENSNFKSDTNDDLDDDFGDEDESKK